MNATLLDLPVETPGTSVSCENCPAVQRLERALEKLRAGFPREVGYWKSQHANAVKRLEQLKAELDQSRGQTRALQDKLFGRKSEKSVRSDRSNELGAAEKQLPHFRTRHAPRDGPPHAEREEYTEVVLRPDLTAPPPPKLVPKGNYGVSTWVLVLLDKYASYRPTERCSGNANSTIGTCRPAR